MYVHFICFLVSAIVGFSLEDGRYLLAQWLKVKPEQLSPHTDEILGFCRYVAIFLCLNAIYYTCINVFNHALCSFVTEDRPWPLH